jgi:hypothetical protein
MPEICEGCEQLVVSVDPLLKMCPDCMDKEDELEKELEATADDRVAEANTASLERVNQAVIDQYRGEPISDELVEQLEIDQTIQVRADLFNANTVSIIDMKQSIEADDNVTDKHYELAKKLKDRFLHLRSVLFELDEQKIGITSEQRSIQQYLNDLANKIREDKREELRLSDINYKPVAPSKPKRKPKTPKPKLFDKKELRRVANELDVSEFTLQMLCVAKNLTPVQAAEELKRLKGESPNGS